MSISLVEVAGANFRTDEGSDILNTAFMGRLGMRKRYLPARLAISRSLAISAPPALLGDELEPGKVIKGDTLFGTGTALSVWIAMIIERAADPELDIRKLIALVGAHWRRGISQLDRDWEQAGQDIAKFVKRLVDVAELPSAGRSPLKLGGTVSGETFSSGQIDVPIGEISEDVSTKEKIVWNLNGQGGSPHSAIMGGVGSGKTRTAAAMLRSIREQSAVPLLAFDFKGDLGTDASGAGYHIDELFEAKTLEPPRNPIPLNVLSLGSTSEIDIAEAASRFRESFSRLKSSRVGDRQRTALHEAASLALGSENPCELRHIRDALTSVYAEHEMKEDGAISTMQEICRFPLFQPTFSPAEFFQHGTFWVSDAHREIMRLLVLRWAEFDDEQRKAIERRFREGMPRTLFRPDAYDEDEWASVQDHAIYRRLTRISGSGGQLTSESAELLKAILARHPNWQPGEDERDEFLSWHESRSGPSGHPENLASIDDSTLVAEALRRQQENQFEEGETWRLLCQAEPDRALRALRSDAEKGQWREEAWRPFFWAADDIEDLNFQRAITDLLLEMPNDSLAPVLPSATSWLRRQAEALRSSGNRDGSWLLQVWDKLADVAFAEQADDERVRADDDPLMAALNEPGGILAWALQALLASTEPQTGSGISQDLLPRFDRAVEAPGNAGKLARCFFGSVTAYLHAVAPDWTQAKLVPLFCWDSPDAAPMWRARTYDRPGSAGLFNALKPAFLQLFERHELYDANFNHLTDHLMSVAIWHRQPESAEYDLSSQETRRALASAPPSVRGHAAWQLWRWMSDEGETPDKGERWRTLIGPFFKDIWPLDARLRDRHISQNLVLMALECDSEFPNAVDAIADVVAPYELYSLDGSLRLERSHSELVLRFPHAFVKLLNALIDPTQFAVPEDLAATLQQCVEAEAGLETDPNYIRLYALRRRRAA